MEGWHKERKKEEQMKGAYGIRRLPHHLEKRGLQDEWCKETSLEMLPTQDRTQK